MSSPKESNTVTDTHQLDTHQLDTHKLDTHELELQHPETHDMEFGTIVTDYKYSDATIGFIEIMNEKQNKIAHYYYKVFFKLFTTLVKLNSVENRILRLENIPYSYQEEHNEPLRTSSNILGLFLLPFKICCCLNYNGCCCCECHICDNKRMKYDFDETDLSIYDNINEILQTMDLNMDQKKIFKMRFIRRLRKLRKDKEFALLIHHLSQSIINIGSVGIPALLSIQHYTFNENDTNGPSNPVYWAAWGLSLAVGLTANFSNIFKVEERMIIMEMTYIKLKQEIWLFICKAGKYCRKYPDTNIIKSHEEMFNEFAYNIEKIWSTSKKQQIEALDIDNKKIINEHKLIKTSTPKHVTN